jgi:hypothetical protein
MFRKADEKMHRLPSTPYTDMPREGYRGDRLFPNSSISEDPSSNGRAAVSQAIGR